jgi:phage replication O-like protein O
VADVQVENGYSRIANEILEHMARIKLSPTQYRILFVVWRYTYGFNRKEHELALSFMANATGCDKRQLQRELKGLADRNIIIQKIVNGVSRTLSFNKNHEEWIGKIAIGEIDNGETTNGGIDNGNYDNGSFTNDGEIVNPSIGESVEGSIGETDNQEIQSLNTSLKTVVVVLDEKAIHQISNEIEQYFCQRRGKGLQVNIDDYKIIKEMVANKIPLDFIKKSIDKSFDEFKPKHVRDEIRTFSFCAPRCYDDWAKNLEKLKPTPIGGDFDGKQGDPRGPTSSTISGSNSLSSRFTKTE